MAIKVTCDLCGAPVRAAGFRVVWAGGAMCEAGDGYGLCGDYCSAVCISKRLEQVGARRPAFQQARDLVADARHRDELVMLGVYDNAEDIAAALPYDPPVAVQS